VSQVTGAYLLALVARLIPMAGLYAGPLEPAAGSQPAGADSLVQMVQSLATAV
jgi:hypothetical protein